MVNINAMNRETALEVIRAHDMLQLVLIKEKLDCKGFDKRGNNVVGNWAHYCTRLPEIGKD